MSELMKAETNVVARQSGGAMQSDTAKAIQEIQGRIIVARNCPRDEVYAIEAIRNACKNQQLAEAGLYEYAKGGTKIEGESIRLAEVMAQHWGNLDYGIRELDRTEEYSELEAYCWDMQTNVRSAITFRVPHWRDTKSGGYAIKDAREKYENMANMGARRLRSRILAIIPPHVKQAAKEQTIKTLMGAGDDNLGERIDKMVARFSGLGVTVPMLEKRLQHKIAATTANEIVQLIKVYNSINDGMGAIADFFDVDKPKENVSQSSQDLEDRLTSGIGEKSQENGSESVSGPTMDQMLSAIDDVAQNKLTNDDKNAIRLVMDGDLVPTQKAFNELYERLMAKQKK